MKNKNEIAVVTTDGGIFWNLHFVDCDELINSKGQCDLGATVDMIAGNLREALGDMGVRKYVYRDRAGKCYINKVEQKWTTTGAGGWK